MNKKRIKNSLSFIFRKGEREKMNKRGQFFIIAAVIIVLVVSGLTGVAIYASAGEDQEVFYDLSKEVGFETKKVLDWGVFHEDNINALTESFLFKYSTYIGEGRVIFIQGNRDELNFKALVFEDTEIGSVGLNMGSNEDKKIVISRKTGGEVKDVILESNRVIVKIDEIDYEFDLNKGENLFFVIEKEVEGEKFVAKG